MLIELAELELHPVDFHEEFPPGAIDLGEDVRQLEGLMLEDVLREQVLLSVPLKALCREDCKGLCPTCGKNRNTEPCSCPPALGDPRWSALRDIREKLEH